MNNSSVCHVKREEDEGDKYFDSGKLEESIFCYTKAITLCDVQQEEQLSVLYSKRSSAHLKLQRFIATINDATQSFMLNKKYSVPLYFRYTALLALQRFDEALVDITALCFLENENIKKHDEDRDKLLINLTVMKTRDYLRYPPKIRVKDITIKVYFKDFKNHALFDESYDGEKLTSYLSNLKSNPNVVNRKAKICLTEATIAQLHDERILAEKFSEAAVKSVENDTKLKVTAMLVFARERMKFWVNRSQIILSAELLKIYEDAINLDKSNVDIYFHRAFCYIGMKLFDKALSDLQRCIAMDPTFETPHLLKITARYHMGDCKDPKKLKKMFKQFDEYIRHHPNSIDAPNEYSNILKKNGKVEKAEEIISKALENNPDNSTLLLEKATFLIEKNPQDACMLLMKALHSNCVHKKELFLFLAIVTAEQAQLKQATIYSDKAIAHNREENDFRPCVAREFYSSVFNACNLLGIDINDEKWLSFVKGVCQEKRKLILTLHCLK
ncbi:mitochondrial import receptor subunit TOM70-like isoform X1 [Leptotrombidium deliense]|uniref:Mitochondrial import receptor subunit TOM70-like isoform X1 n=1 Tax=Leptotrombidium deliense TaxID=299467 RepID=A0A443S9Y8_9ACAR|nr:mitochondrial import receptor subunit TOM70-like isoform X1 [Leptotrombidium deliense]